MQRSVSARTIGVAQPSAGAHWRRPWADVWLAVEMAGVHTGLGCGGRVSTSSMRSTYSCPVEACAGCRRKTPNHNLAPFADRTTAITYPSNLSSYLQPPGHASCGGTTSAGRARATSTGPPRPRGKSVAAGMCTGCSLHAVQQLLRFGGLLLVSLDLAVCSGFS